LAKNNDNLKRKSIVKNDDFSIKKRFSQNFLTDENIILKIVNSANIDETTGVIEIGPGLGALTKKIAELTKHLLVYEIDQDLIPHLQRFFKSNENITLINEDILNVDINQAIQEHFPDVNHVIIISNLPYHITTPIIMKVLEETKGIDSMVLMMQIEVAKRITSTPNTKDYNALSIIIQHQTEAKYLFKVPKTVFYPQPKVDSAVVKLNINPAINNKNNQGFYQFVHKCFTQRRKTLINNLYHGYNIYTKEELANILNDLGLHHMIRSEALHLEDFLALYKDYFEEKIQ